MRARSRLQYTSFSALLLIVLMAWPAPAEAQRRGGRGGRGGRPIIVTSRVYRPFYGPHFYHPYFWGYSGWHPFWGYPMTYRIGPELGAARLQVTPKDTEVYLDGRLVGVVDDFDGIAQRLRVPPGQYVLELYREGTRPWQQQVMLTPGSTLKVQHHMEPLSAGESAPPRPVAPPPAPEATPAPPPAADEEPRRPIRRREGNARTAASALSIRVQPEDAEVLIDGEAWESAPAGNRLLVDVASGRHRVVVRKPGYETYETEVDVEAGDTRTLNVSLRRQD